MQLAVAAAAWRHHLGECPGSESCSSFSCTYLGYRSRQPWDVSKPLNGPKQVPGSCYQFTSTSQWVKVKRTKGFSRIQILVWPRECSNCRLGQKVKGAVLSCIWLPSVVWAHSVCPSFCLSVLRIVFSPISPEGETSSVPHTAELGAYFHTWLDNFLLSFILCLFPDCKGFGRHRGKHL